MVNKDFMLFIFFAINSIEHENIFLKFTLYDHFTNHHTDYRDHIILESLVAVLG